MKNILNYFIKDDIGEPPWDYNFLVNLDEGLYPLYLKKIFKYRTGEKLPLKFDFKQQAWVIDKKRCKTFNQKLQWIKLNFRRVEPHDGILGVRTRSSKKSAGTHKGVNDILDTFGSESKDFKEENSGYGVTDLMRKCTDKVAVRDFVRERIGEEYLKPVLQIIPDDKSTPHPNPLLLGEGTNSKIQGFNQKMKADKLGGHPLPAGEGWGEGTALASKDVSTYFDQINWNKLPNAFVIKCNHGSKWQFIIKDKEQFLNTPQLFRIVKRQMTGWLEQEYFPWNGFEMQYKGIKPKLLFEPFFHNEDNTPLREIEVYCFKGKPKIFVNVRYGNKREISYYDEEFNQIDLILHPDGNNLIVNTKADDYINQTFDLSAKLCKSSTRLAKNKMTTVDSQRNDSLERKKFQEKELSKYFSFVRCDWFVFNNRLYFNEMTFTPYSGFVEFDKKWNKKFGSWIN